MTLPTSWNRRLSPWHKIFPWRLESHSLDKVMLHFTDEQGKPFSLDYDGAIQCRDETDAVIAICQEDQEDGRSEPEHWDDWEVQIDGGEEELCILQRAVASAYVACTLAQRITVAL